MDDQPASGPMHGRTQPGREQVLGLTRLTILDHPLVSNLVTILRNIDIPPAEFERAIHELTRFLIWSAMAGEPLSSTTVQGFSSDALAGTRFARGMAALVILRAGLSMVPPLRILMPDAPVYQVGVTRNEQTLEPRLYYSNIPENLAGVDHLFLLDPMLATGGSAAHSLALIRSIYTGDVSFLGLIGAPIGVTTLLERDDRVRVFLAVLDEELNDQGYIVPGLGDAGDRLFGTK